MQHLSVEKKLRYSSIMITTVVVMILSGLFLFAEYSRYKQEIELDLKNSSGIIAENISTALIFEDVDTANEILNTLKAKSKIVYAAVYDKNDHLFTAFDSNTRYRQLSQKIDTDTIEWQKEHVLIKTPIMQRGEKLGTVMLVYTREEFRDYMRFLLLLTVAAIFSAILIANMLFKRIQKLMIEPLLKLTGAMQHVSREKDFTVQVQNDSPDEIGILTRGFNQMIQKIKEELDFRQKVEAELKDIAMFDQLTRLPNRHYFHMHLKQTIHRCKRKKVHFALLFIDLDGFKNVNDTLGHDYGDLLLQEVAVRLKQCIRESDFVARLGGDEFTIILEDICKKVDIAKICDQIIYEISKEITLMTKKAYVSCSIGIARFMIDTDTASGLMQYADLAMYYAKEHGKNGHIFYDEDLKIEKSRTHIIETHLRSAIKEGELTLMYQPKMDLKKEEVTSMEALLRWNSVKLGYISPAEFIPVAEKSSLIIDLENWVVEEVCRQLKVWDDLFEVPMRVAINISQMHFKQKNFLDEFNTILQKYRTNPHTLEIELTESVFLGHKEETIEKLSYLRALGVEISIDDFGTGYSSLSYLKQLPIDTVKIDKSFIDGLPDDSDDVAITKTILDLAKRFSLKTIAEGVETDKQVQLLKEMGCDSIQGYFFYKPMEAEAFEKAFIKIRV